MYVYMCVYMYVRMYVCMYVCIDLYLLIGGTGKLVSVHRKYKHMVDTHILTCTL